MKRPPILMSAILAIAALLGSSHQASARNDNVRLVATINGSGGAVMDSGAPLTGTTTYFINARLDSDGTTAFPYTIAIQRFGGKGVGHWTLDIGRSGFRACHLQ